MAKIEWKMTTKDGRVLTDEMFKRSPFMRHMRFLGKLIIATVVLAAWFAVIVKLATWFVVTF